MKYSNYRGNIELLRANFISEMLAALEISAVCHSIIRALQTKSSILLYLQLENRKEHAKIQLAEVVPRR